MISPLAVLAALKSAGRTARYRAKIHSRVKTRRKIRCTQDNFALCLQLRGPLRDRLVPRCSRVGGEDWQEGRQWRGSVVIDKSFVIMVLACAMAPIVGAGIYLVVHLF